MSKGGTHPHRCCPVLDIRVPRQCRFGRKIRRTLLWAEEELKGLHPTGTRREGCPEKPLAREVPTVPQTDTGRRVEDTQARERTLVKELGKLTP